MPSSLPGVRKAETRHSRVDFGRWKLVIMPSMAANLLGG